MWKYSYHFIRFFINGQHYSLLYSALFVLGCWANSLRRYIVGSQVGWCILFLYQFLLSNKISYVGLRWYLYVLWLLSCVNTTYIMEMKSYNEICPGNRTLFASISALCSTYISWIINLLLPHVDLEYIENKTQLGKLSECDKK